MNRFANAAMPRYPNFNEEDLSDKPAIAAFFPNLMTDDDIASLQDHYRGRMGSLLAVDDMVERVVKSLKRPASTTTPTSSSPRTTGGSWASTGYTTRSPRTAARPE